MWIKVRRWLVSLIRALLVVLAILFCAAAWFWFTDIAPHNALSAVARSHARRIEARFRSEGRYRHIRITDSFRRSGGLSVSGEVRRGELQELKRILRDDSSVEYIEYHVAELELTAFEALERKGALTPARDAPQSVPHE